MLTTSSSLRAVLASGSVVISDERSLSRCYVVLLGYVVSKKKLGVSLLGYGLDPRTLEMRISQPSDELVAE